jgi:hypothetical protein
MDDRDLEQALRGVPIPGGLASRVAAAAGDAMALDRALRDVTVPDGLPQRIATAPPARRPPAPHRGHRRPARAATALVRDALSVAAALAGIWLVAAGGASLSRTLSAPTPRSVALRSVAPRAVASRPTPQGPRDAALEAQAADPPGGPRRPLVAGHDRDVSVPAARAAGPDRPAAETIAAAPARAPETVAIPQVRGAAVGLEADAAAWPRSALRTPRDAWRRVPRSPRYDLLFELTHGEQPFVDPRAGDLRADVPPLTVQTDTFDRFVAARPRGPQLRAEHALAAVSPPRDPPATPGSVAVALHAVGSLRGSAGRPTLIVEVAATAGGFAVPAAPHDAVRATIVLDRAAGSEPLAWRWGCRAVAAVADRMQSGDRVTLVVAGPVPRVAIRDATGPDLARVAADLAGLAASPGSDLDAALAVARTATADTARTIVVVQDGADASGGVETRTALGRWQERTASGPGDEAASDPGSVDFVLVDPGTEFEPSRPAVSFGRTAADAVAIRRALLAGVFGRETLVAGRGRLTVDFDPATVAAYRLVGHRQSAVESLADGHPETIDLHVGETARAVYEVVARSATPVKVAARFQWTSGAGSHEVRAALRGGPDATATTPSPHGCELLLAVSLGDEATGSAHAVPRGRAAAAELIARWRARGDVTPLGTVLADAVMAARGRGADGLDP